MKEQKKYLTVKEASALLSIKPLTLYKMALRKEIPSYKVGKLRRFEEGEILSWIESQKVETRKA